jgi:CRISPR-associated endonuclease Csn1
MYTILGVDLGITSVGWAVKEEENNQIMGMGSRIIPLSTDDKEEFSKGNAISKNQNRTLKRTQRKGYDRYQLRRKNLIYELKQNNMLPDSSVLNNDKLSLWKLRADAVTEKLQLPEIGRVLLHLNQKRGYKSARSIASADKKETEYVAEVKSRFQKLNEMELTIGQHFYRELKINQFYRTKEQVFPREAYIDEFEKIMAKQKSFYPELITDELIGRLRDEIIYYQRKLKSQKGLVAVCEFEGFFTKLTINNNEKEIFVGPRVAHRSSPLFQVCKIWENINNISLRYKTGENVQISLEQKKLLFEYLDNNEKMTVSELLKILKLKKDDVYGNKQLDKGLQGNMTKWAIVKCFPKNFETGEILKFELKIEEKAEETFLIDRKTGEVLNSKNKKTIGKEIENEPLFKLWHTIYSLEDVQECKNALIRNFIIPDDIADKLAAIDFSKQAYGNKSHRAIRKILPYLMEGDVYSDACSYAGYNHSNSLTKSENSERKLKDRLQLLEKNSLRQPVVEKILNQMINVVNAVIEKYGKPDEIRVELARELKMSREERLGAYKANNLREKENIKIEEELETHGIRGTRKNIIKWRLYHETAADEGKVNSLCVYCGSPISFSAAMFGEEVDVDHIIPKSRLFDDSQSNKVLVHRKCNANKNDLTAFDFINSKSTEEFNAYVERVNTLFKQKIISKTKRDKLLTPGSKIPDDFIERQLRETQYIAKKARQILSQICHNVWATSGSVTSELRHLWGWDTVLETLQLPKYRQFGLTSVEQINNNGHIITREKITGWNKRDDHRHHAIDALTIACTKQSFIQRINNLSSGRERSNMKKEIEGAKAVFDKSKTLLENYLIYNRPFTTEQVLDVARNILISYKTGKKVAVPGKRKIKLKGRKVVVQPNIIVPRGALSEEQVYGKIKLIEKHKPVEYLFENPHLIYKDYIKKIVEERLLRHNNVVSDAVKSLKKEPIFLDDSKKTILAYATCYKDFIVIKKKIAELKEKQIEDVIDPVIKQKLYDRLEKYGGKAVDAFKDLENNPVWYDEQKKIPIISVRCFTGLTAVEPLRRNENGENTGYVKPGNNHHIAIYIDEAGVKHISICTFWNAVDRKKAGLPVIIKNPATDLAALEQINSEKLPAGFIEKLPKADWKFLESYQQNEMFILELDVEKITEAVKNGKYDLLSSKLYRVQKIFYNGEKLEIYFRHHLETKLVNTESAKTGKRYIQVTSLSALEKLIPYKIVIDYLGRIREPEND